MEDSKPEVLLDVSAAVPASGGAVRVTVAGRGEAAERLAADVAELVRLAVAQALVVSAANAPAPAIDAAPTNPEPVATRLSAEASLSDTLAAVPAHLPPAEAVAAPVARPWFQRHRSRISGAVGLFLIALAVLIPFLVPVAMRREILPMPIGLGLVGAISLFSAFLPEPQRRSPRAKAQVRMAAPAPAEVQTSMRRSATSSAAAKPQSIPRRVIGLSFGAALALAGLIAPFALPNVSVDDRFLMMLGFAPIALIGMFLLWVFLRRPPAPTLNAPNAGKRGAQPVAALSGTSGALAALGLMLGMVVALVVLATVLPLLNAQP
jgi:hypothetical protein